MIINIVNMIDITLYRLIVRVIHYHLCIYYMPICMDTITG